MKTKLLSDTKRRQHFTHIGQLFKADQKQAALSVITKLAEHHPDDYRISVLHGFLLAENGEYEKGLDLLERATQQAPEDAWALRTFGEVLYKGRDYQQAKLKLETADRIQPGDATTLLLLGNTLLDSGHPEQAWTHYQKALALNPFSLELLSNASAFIQFQDPADPRIQFLHQQLLNTELPNEQKSTAHFILGKAYQDLSQPETAFYHYHQGNQLVHQVRKAEADLEPVLHDLHAFYTPEIKQVLSKLGLPVQQEILIIGVSRSGKSLVERLLACHPSVTAGGESLAFFNYASPLMNNHNGPLNYLRQITPESVIKDAQGYLKLRKWPDTRFLTNTLPSNLYLLNIYSLWFPAAPIIFVQRNPDDQGLACYFKQYKEGNAFSYNLYSTGREIALSERLMDFWVQHLPNPCITINYEDLVNKPAATTQLIYRFLGLDWQPEYFKTLQAQKSLVSHLAPHQSLDGTASLRTDYIGWSKVYENHLEPLRQGYQQARHAAVNLEQIRDEKTYLEQAALNCHQALKNHSYERAAKLAKTLLQRRPDQLSFLQLAGISRSLIGHDQQALDYFNHAQQFNTNDIGLTINHTRALLRAGKQAEAKRLFADLQQQQAENPAVQRLGLEVLLNNGNKHKKDLQQGLAQVDALLASAADDPELLAFKAGILHRLGQDEQASAVYEQLLAQLQQLPAAEAWRSAPLKTRVLLAYAQLQADARQPDAAAICEVLWQAASQHPLTRTSATCWAMYKTWLPRSRQPEHQALVRLHRKVAGIWQHYAADELEHSFGDYGLPYQSFEPLQLPGTRPAMARLATYGLADHLPQDARALDIGCNHGYLLMGLAEHLSAGIGFDISKACIEVGQTVAEHLGVADRIQLQHSTFDDFCQTRHQPFDLILACAVHHWINKPLPQFGRILYDWVKPGGLVLIESQGSRQRDATEPDFDAKVSQMMQPGFICIAQGSLCDDEINYREFRLLQRPINETATLEDQP